MQLWVITRLLFLMILANGTPVVAVPSIPGYQRDTGAGTVLLSEMAIGWIRTTLNM